MSNNYVELFLELYSYGLKRLDRDLQSIANSLLNRQGFQFHLVIVGTYNNRFVRKYNIDTPALSLGIMFIIPIGVILLHENFKHTFKEWIRFTIAHELGHICLNHFPINIFVSEVWKSLSQDLRDFWVGLKWFIYILSTISGQPHIRFPEEEITAQKELRADEWAVRVLGEKEPALSFLKWVEKQGLTISHISPIGGLPALTIDERIKHIETIGI